MRTVRHQRHGFTLVEILVVVAVIGLLVSIALPNFMKTRATAQQKVCIENLYQIESAKQVYGLEMRRQSDDPVSEADLVGPTLYIKSSPLCPAGGQYDYKTVGETAECSFKDELKHIALVNE